MHASLYIVVAVKSNVDARSAHKKKTPHATPFGYKVCDHRLHAHKTNCHVVCAKKMWIICSAVCVCVCMLSVWWLSALSAQRAKITAHTADNKGRKKERKDRTNGKRRQMKMKNVIDTQRVFTSRFYSLACVTAVWWPADSHTAGMEASALCGGPIRYDVQLRFLCLSFVPFSLYHLFIYLRFSYFMDGRACEE